MDGNELLLVVIERTVTYAPVVAIFAWGFFQERAARIKAEGRYRQLLLAVATGRLDLHVEEEETEDL